MFQIMGKYYVDWVLFSELDCVIDVLQEAGVGLFPHQLFKASVLENYMQGVSERCLDLEKHEAWLFKEFNTPLLRAKLMHKSPLKLQQLKKDHELLIKKLAYINQITKGEKDDTL